MHFHSPAKLDQPRYQLWPESSINARIQHTMDTLAAATESARCISLAWQLAWLVVDANLQITPQLDALGRAEYFIQQYLSTDFSVSSVAAAAGVSQNQLLRYMQAKHHCSIATYIQQQRAQRALTLLQTSDLPIAAIGAEVGIPDRQYFNKLMRRHFGKSPTALRAASG